MASRGFLIVWTKSEYFDGGGEPTWEDVFPTRVRETRRDGGGSDVADRLANPPPLGH